MKSMRPNSRSGPRAFTLVEVVAALALLGAVSATLLVAVGHATHAGGQAVRTLRTTTLCASEVAALRAGLTSEGEAPCEEAPGYHREIAELAPDGQAPQALRAYLITVTSPTGDPAETTEVTVWLPPLAEDAGGDAE